MFSASERAIARCAGDLPGEAPQNTQILVGGGVLEEMLRGEGWVVLEECMKGTGEEGAGDTPPDAMVVRYDG
jgi:hypothetical protein